MTITPEAARRLSLEADFRRAVLSVRHVLGCGGSGFRVSVEENVPEEGHRFESEGIPIVMDDYAFENLRGAVLEIDPAENRTGWTTPTPP